MQQLGDDQVGDVVGDRRAEEDDPLAEQARVDVERALAARGLLDHHRDQRAHEPHSIEGPGAPCAPRDGVDQALRERGPVPSGECGRGRCCIAPWRADHRSSTRASRHSPRGQPDPSTAAQGRPGCGSFAGAATRIPGTPNPVASPQAAEDAPGQSSLRRRAVGCLRGNVAKRRQCNPVIAPHRGAPSSGAAREACATQFPRRHPDSPPPDRSVRVGRPELAGFLALLLRRPDLPPAPRPARAGSASPPRRPARSPCGP